MPVSSTDSKYISTGFCYVGIAGDRESDWILIRRTVPWIGPIRFPGLALRAPARAYFLRTNPGACAPWGPLVPIFASHVHPMCNTRSTFKIFRCNTYNIRLKTEETLETCV